MKMIFTSDKWLRTLQGFLLPIGYKNNFLITSMRAVLAGIQEIIFPHF
jgi:hypothetical protein